MRRTAGQVALAGWCLASMSGCLSLAAQGPATAPLHTPEAPARVVTPPAEDTVAPPKLEPVTAAPATTPPATGNTTTTSTPPVPSRPDRPVSASPPATPPPAAEPPGTLQTTAKTDDMQRKIQLQLDNAERDLRHVDYRTLPHSAQAQYDWAQYLAGAARKALKDKNFNQADWLSQKAALVASLLPKGGPSTSASVA